MRRRTQEINEFVFQLEKYTSSQQQLSHETLATIDKYKDRQVKQELSDRREKRMKKRQDAE